MAERESIYSNPRYYDLGFSFRDIPAEVDFFENLIGLYSGVPVSRMLEMASGVSPHLTELARRGYHYTGLDINPAMVAYASGKARSEGTRADFIEADMRKFTLERGVEFAFTMCGSLYVQSTADILSHFDAVARALAPGGLYLLDWCINFEWDQAVKGDHGWTIEREGIRIDVRFALEIVDRASQLARHRLGVEVNDHGTIRSFESVDIVRVILPQEFLLLVEKSGNFEFIGWWNNWDLKQPMDKAGKVDRPIALIRRR
ncbi:MAG: class I SAM-dependent methyltransferase [bacterium]